MFLREQTNAAEELACYHARRTETIDMMHRSL